MICERDLRKKQSKGFSLVEVLVSFLVGTLFIAVVTQSYFVFVQNIEKTQKKFKRLRDFETFCRSQQYAFPSTLKIPSFTRDVLVETKKGIFLDVFLQDNKENTDKDSFSVCVFVAGF